MKQEPGNGDEAKTSTMPHKCFNDATHFIHSNHRK
jgi:hypothetical protein